MTQPTKKHEEQNETHFGFTRVSPEEKTRKVGEVFQSVASRYDVMNDLMSGGLHRLWKRDMVSALPLRDGAAMLDLAGGTGDISFRVYEQLQVRGQAMEITISDINPAMLEEGKKRATNKGYIGAFNWKEINAESIPFQDDSLDIVTIAFGIRNVTNIPRALKEIVRVLRPGGVFACLEFSHLSQPVLQKIYDAYSFSMIPLMGQMVTGDKDSYQYLVESIRQFPKAKDFARMLEEAGLQQVRFRQMTGGVVALHTGWKI